MVSPYTDQSRDGNIAISVGPRFSGEMERIGNIAMLISASRRLADDISIARLRASILRDGGRPRVTIWSCGLNRTSCFLKTLANFVSTISLVFSRRRALHRPMVKRCTVWQTAFMLELEWLVCASGFFGRASGFFGPTT